MALFRGIQEYIALDANNITLVFDSGNIVNISGNIFLYPPQGHPILYKYLVDWSLSGIMTRNTSSCGLDDSDFTNDAFLRHFPIRKINLLLIQRLIDLW